MTGLFVSSFAERRAVRRAMAVVLIGIVASSVLLTATPSPVLAATLTVTTTADSGAGSLRDAINAAGDGDVIVFAIPGAGPHTIALASVLVPISESITIDATAEAIGGAPGVILDGSGAGAGANGLMLHDPAGTSAVYGLAITGFLGDGIEVLTTDGTDDVRIGGLGEGQGNTITANGGNGVTVRGAGGAAGVTIVGNRIDDNGGLGIDLGDDGITLNDDGADLDAGPNDLLDFPVITVAGVSDIAGTYTAQAGSTYRIDVYASSSCDPSGNGEGAMLVDSDVDPGTGIWAMDAAAVNGTFLTATVTRDQPLGAGQTSEFSECFEVVTGLPTPGTWVGAQGVSLTPAVAVVPTAGTSLAAGASDAGSAQFTYGIPDSNPLGGDGESGVWSFYTTAADSGTIEVPWRYSGFHAFAGVTVGLRAVVVRDGDTVISDTVVLTAGPQSCSPYPCPEPSGGFDYESSSDASFTVEPGDIYGFVLTASNGDSNETLNGGLTIGTEVPTDCADAQTLYSGPSDGRYVIHPVDGQRTIVYCNDMASDFPADYLELTNIGGYNFSSYAAGGAAVGTSVTTSFTKIRFDPATLLVDIADLTFATTAGGPLLHPESPDPLPVQAMPYATAMACSAGGGPDGTANVNLGGTGFAINDTWSGIGTVASGGPVIGAEDSAADVTANGFCGWQQPDPSGAPLYVFNPTTPRFVLQLRYANEPPLVTVETPVLFASIARTGDTADLYALIDGAANTSVTVQVRTSASCTNGVLDGATLIDTIGPVATDAEGYRALDGVDGIATGDFVAIRVITPNVTADSLCVRTTADNDYWPRALVLGDTSTATTNDVIEVAGKSRWYRFPIVPDQRVTISLTSLPADYDLAVFKDIAKEFEAQLLPEDADDLTQLTAEFAPSVFSPSVFSPSVFSPSVFSPDAYAPSVFSPSVFSPSVFSPSVFSPSVFSPSVFSPSVFSPSVFSPSVFSPSVFSPSVFSPSVFSPSVFSDADLERAFSSAQTRSLVGVSANAGTGPESVVVNTWNNTGFFYIRVSGRAGAFDPEDLFTVTVAKAQSSCATVNDTILTPRPTKPDAGDYSTVILTDSSELALGDGSPSSLLGKLNALKVRPEVDGVLVDIAGDSRIGQLRAQVAANKGCPFAVNLLAQEIKGIVDSYRTPAPGAEPLRYVTIIGDDTVIPFFRYPDQSLLGQESGYFPPVNSDSISEASLRRDFVLSQDAYGSGVSIDVRTSAFPVPGLAVGRLVETPSEIIGMLDAYTSIGGVVQPGSSLVTGYDFLEDAANEVSAELAAGTGASVDELITPNGLSPLDPASWTATDLRTELLGNRHDLIFLAGHFSANSALAADFSTSIITTELDASTVDLANAIVFSAGCHSGYNLVDGEALAGASLPLDWAQAFARKRSVLIAGTGYQYGDTDFLEYSERLYRDFARELRAGVAGSTVSVGEALANAKRTYLATTQDIRGIHEKALLEATLFGLPMFGVEMPSGRGATPGTAGAITPMDVASGPAADLGLATSDLAIVPSLSTLQTRTLDVIEAAGVTGTVIAEWLEGPDGVVTNPAEPAIPKQTINVTSTNAAQVLRGVGFRGGTYDDMGNVLPLTGAPTTELRGVHASFVSPVFYPMKLATPNYFGELAGTGGTNLIVTPVQHRTDDANPGRSVRRTYSDLDLRLFYSGNLTAAALSDAPTIVKVSTALVDGDLRVEAQVVGDPKAAIHEVWVVWTDGNGQWLPLDLVQDATDSRLWTGIVIDAPTDIRFVVQAANGVGLVAFDDNLGQYYSASGLAPIATTMTLISPVPSAGQYGGSATVTAELKAGIATVPGKLVTISIGGSTAFGVTGSNGRVTVAVPLSSQPGALPIVATFAGDQTHLTSSANAPFTISAGTAALSLSVPVTTTVGGSATAVATLTGAGIPLIQTSVAFLVTPPGATTPTVTEAKTDFAGQARLVLPTAVVGTYQVEVRYGSIVSVGGGQVLDLRDDVYGPASASLTHRVVWPFTGFFAPVDNLPTRNQVKAGATVPVKFSLGGNRGLAILATGYPKAIKITCTSGLPVDAIEETTTANSGLSYDASTGQYKYNWKTLKSYAGACYRLDVKFVDGSTYSADFQFK